LINDYQTLLNIIEFLPDATFVINRNAEVIIWNRALEEMTGVHKSKIVGQGRYAYAVPFYGEVRPMLIDVIINNSCNLNNRYQNLEYKKDKLSCEKFAPVVYNGRGAFLRATAAPLYNDNGDIIGAMESIRDVDDQKKAEEQLKYISLHDPLTGLYNRTFYEAELDRLHKEGRLVGLMICDVDGLKGVNDIKGHQAGDQLLMKAAKLLQEAFTENDMVARIGGDEFVVIFPEPDLVRIKKAKSLIQETLLKHNQENPQNPLNISIGYDIGDCNMNDYKSIFAKADDDMYLEKLNRNQKNRNLIIKNLVKMLGAKSFTSEDHVKRLQRYIQKISQYFKLPKRKIQDLTLLARFHDIGQIGITDEIVLKRGSLTMEETNIMKQHVEIGFGIAQMAQEFSRIADWILKHHERWDGNGYPLGLKGEEIPLECRIMAVIDAYDAMTSDRPYRKAKTHQEAVRELESCSGIQFDPHIVEIFVESLKRQEVTDLFLKIYLGGG
jgi:diguanylate cyclase (GGDEF)-like protein/PAS domain S-box-containing protein